MGGRGAKSGVKVRTEQKNVSSGVLGKQIGERSAIDTGKLNWWIDKQKESERDIRQINKYNDLQFAVENNSLNVIGESEKAVKVSFENTIHSTMPNHTQWIPKSVMPTTKTEPTFESNGRFKPGMKVKNDKWGGTVQEITATHTYIKTTNGKTMKVKNENMDTYFK